MYIIFWLDDSLSFHTGFCNRFIIIIIIIITIIIITIQLSLTGSSPYISTDKTNKNEYT
jgi:hypothetical protein